MILLGHRSLFLFDLLFFRQIVAEVVNFEATILHWFTQNDLFTILLALLDVASDNLVGGRILHEGGQLTSDFWLLLIVSKNIPGVHVDGSEAHITLILILGHVIPSLERLRLCLLGSRLLFVLLAIFLVLLLFLFLFVRATALFSVRILQQKLRHQ